MRLVFVVVSVAQSDDVTLQLLELVAIVREEGAVEVGVEGEEVEGLLPFLVGGAHELA
jgi:hypothetical protein